MINDNKKVHLPARSCPSTFDLNRYLNHYLRVQANLIKVLDVKRPGSEFDSLDPLIAAVRLQWYLPQTLISVTEAQVCSCGCQTPVTRPRVKLNSC